MSVAISEAITRKSASNLALAFVLLPPERRAGMSALYAFCREVDDVADEETAPVSDRRRRLAAWREDIRQACTGGRPEFPVNRELQPFIVRHHLAYEHFDALIRGCEMDLETTRYETLAGLEDYCYHVASVVGLLSIPIFGYQQAGCQDYAVCLGKALQLTNILRDVRNDAERGRIYLPLAVLRQHGVTEQEVLDSHYSPRYRAAAEVVAARARELYAQARQALPAGEERSMMTAELMGGVYWRLLRKLEAAEFNVFGPEKIRLGKARKVGLVLRAWWCLNTGRRFSAYGDR